MRRLAAAALLALPVLVSCARRGAGVRPGDRVRLHYRVLADGRVYDTTEGSEPVTLVVGEGALPREVEARLVGMRPGEERTITIVWPPSAEKASVLPRRSFSALKEPLRPGMKVLGVKAGTPAEATIVAVDSSTVTLSFAHPLAGKEVSFTLRLVSIER